MSRSQLTSSDISPEIAARLAEELRDARTVTIGRETVELREHVRDVLGALLGAVAEGQRVDIVPVDEVLTTQQAAEILEVSRPTLIKMLDDGLIPFERPGVHRRIRRDAIDEFLAAAEARRRRALADLADEFDPDLPDEYVTTR